MNRIYIRSLITNLLLLLSLSSIAQIGSNEIRYAALSPDGNYIALSGGEELHGIKIIDIKGDHVYSLPGRALDMRFREDSKRLILAGGYQFDLATQKVLSERCLLLTHLSSHAAVLLKKSNLILSFGTDGMQMQTENGTPLMDLYYYDDSLRIKQALNKEQSLTISNETEKFSIFGTVNTNSWSVFEKMKCDHGQWFSDIAVSNDETHIALTHEDQIALLEISTLKLQNLQSKFSKRGMYQLGFTPDKKYLVSNSSNQLEIRSMDNPKVSILSEKLTDKMHSVYFVTSTADSKRLIGYGHDFVATWSIEGKLLKEFSTKSKKAFTFIHPRDYVISFNHNEHKLIIYNLNGDLQKTFEDVDLPYWTYHNYHPQDLIYSFLSEDGNSFLALTKGQESYKIIDLSFLK